MRSRIVRWVLLPGLALAALGVGVFLLGLAPSCPPVGALAAYRPPEASRVFAADGSPVADLSPQRREVVELDAVSPLLRDGFVAVEDRRFHRHHGIDLRGVLRAAWRNLASLSVREGFSTIPMQLARNVFPEELPRSQLVRRKLCEIRLAGEIEERFDKREILSLYLNQIYLGQGLYGVEAAAEGYFATSAADVTAAQAALLVGLAQSPEGYNPRRSPLEAARRRNVVLDVMAREGVIAQDEAEVAMDAPLGLAPPSEPSRDAPYFIAAVRRELRASFGPRADATGLRVHTALDLELQRDARRALSAQIGRIEAGEYGPYPHPTPDDVVAVEPAATGSPLLQGAIIVLDPYSGAVRALVGGRDFATSPYDRATRARRQPGSAFKPIIYAAALESGLPPTERLATTPISVADDNGRGPWRPGDHMPDSVDALPIRDALAVSSNHAAVRVGQWVGVDRVIGMARRLGIETEIPRLPSIFLGAAEVAPIDLVAAYGAFGNGGYRVEPRLITRVEDGDGTVLWRAPSLAVQALDPGVAFMMADMLGDVIDRGTGRAVRRRGFALAAAGKTGTTNDARDVWFIGLTPELAAGVWLGFDQPEPILPGASGGSLAAPVWADMMREAYRDRPAPRPWSPPASLVRLAVDTATGDAATGNCPDDAVRTEYFLPGTEPRESCHLHPESAVERLFEGVWDRMRGLFGGSDTTRGTAPRDP
ncbi:MAG: penicillin-binding protein 1A [Gemmatimonadota bacterium]